MVFYEFIEAWWRIYVSTNRVAVDSGNVSSPAYRWANSWTNYDFGHIIQDLVHIDMIIWTINSVAPGL